MTASIFKRHALRTVDAADQENTSQMQVVMALRTYIGGIAVKKVVS